MTRRSSRAVMERRSPAKVEEDTPLKRLWRNLDYFPTPPWAARAVAHRLRQYDPGATTIWDPMCGEGHFAEPLREVFGRDNVFSSDIYDFGYGAVHDFFEFEGEARRSASSAPPPDWIVTNPAFSKVFDFITYALTLARRGVIVAPCRLALLEGGERCPMLYEGANPLTTMMPFVERVPMQLGSWDPRLSSATAYAAFVFHKGRAPSPINPFKTGTKALYWHADDPARFAHSAPVPLFEKVAAAGMFATEEFAGVGPPNEQGEIA